MKQSVNSQAEASGSMPKAAQKANIAVSLPANAAASTGDNIIVPVTIGAVEAGSPIESFDFSVYYDPAVLQLNTPTGGKAGTLSAACSVFANAPIAGRVIVSGACAQQSITTAASGALYKLSFTVIGKGSQTSDLTFVNPANSTDTFQFNNGNASAATTNGKLTVTASTAANVSVTGRVTNNQGRGIGNVLMTMIDSAGNQRQTQTTSFGYYRFESVAAGETITLTAKAKRYRFNLSSIVRTVGDDLSELNFITID
jgi:hypothetical protein